MRPRHDSGDPAAPRRTRLAALLAALAAASAACTAPDYDPADFAGTFEDGAGGTIALRSDGTGTLTGLYGEDRDRPGTWDLVEPEGAADSILFFYDEPEPGATANAQLWIGSADELYLLPDGPDGAERVAFERVGDA